MWVLTVLGILKSYKVSRYSNSVSSLFAILPSLPSKEIFESLLTKKKICAGLLSQMKSPRFQHLWWPPLVACNAWLPATGPRYVGRRAARGPSATFHSSVHAAWLADKKPACRDGPHQSPDNWATDYYATEHTCNDTLWPAFLTAYLW